MEELSRACIAENSVAFRKDWELKEQAIQKLSEYGYVQIVQVCEEEEQEHMFFVKPLKINDLSVLRETLPTKKDLLIGPSLAEESEVQNWLESNCYIESAESKVVGIEEGWKYFILGYVKSDSQTLNPVLEPGGLPSERADNGEDWKPCGKCSFKSVCDISNTQPKQSVVVEVVVQPYAKVNEFHLFLKLEMNVCSVAVPKNQFASKDGKLGFFPDRIKLSFKPNWPGEAVAEIFSRTELGDYGRPITSTRPELGIQLGVSKIVQFLVSAKWESSSKVVYPESLESVREENAFCLEWSLTKWKRGSKYKPENRFWFSTPRLPFTGTSPKLEPLPELMWTLGKNQTEGLAFDFALDFDMQYIAVSGVIIKSVQSERHRLERRMNVPINLPPDLQKIGVANIGESVV